MLFVSTVLPSSCKTLDLNSKLLPDTFPEGDPSEYALPVFLEHPQNAFASRGSPAKLTCVVAHSNKANFVCNEETKEPTSEEEILDEKTKLKAKKLTLEITRTQVLDGIGRFTCHCSASSSKGSHSTKDVTISSACK